MAPWDVPSISPGVIGRGRPQGLGGFDQHPGEPGHLLNLLPGAHVSSSVHRQGDSSVMHYRLHGFGVGPAHPQPGPAGVLQAVEVEKFTVVVYCRHKVALFTPGTFLGVLPGGAQPGSPCVGKVGPLGESARSLPFAVSHFVKLFIGVR
jgi:hypothetical protein